MRDLRVGVDAVRGGVIVGRAVGVTDDVFDREHALVGSDVREHDAADHVPDRPNTVRGRVQVLIDDDAAALELHPGLLRFETLRVRHAPDREQHLVCVDRAALTAG